jgi:acyl transferase domain-containing protein
MATHKPQVHAYLQCVTNFLRHHRILLEAHHHQPQQQEEQQQQQQQQQQSNTNNDQNTPLPMVVTVPKYYLPTLEEFVRAQMEDQAAGLCTNTNRASSTDQFELTNYGVSIILCTV